MIFALGRIRWIRPINCQLDGILSVKNGRFVLRCRRVELRYLCPSARSSLAVRLAIVSGHAVRGFETIDRKSTRLNSKSLMRISYAVFCLKKKKKKLIVQEKNRIYTLNHPISSTEYT